MSQTLREFAGLGYHVTYVGAQQPFLFRFLDAAGVQFCVCPPLVGGAIRKDGAVRSADVLSVAQLAEAMIDRAQHAIRSGSRVIFWACYLFPYGFAALHARFHLMQQGDAATLWLTPTGSDVWEIGPQLQRVTESLLNSPLVDAVTAYTDQFASEIVSRYGLKRPVRTIPPGLDWNRFDGLKDAARFAARRTLELPDGAFVIISHSNMRPIKRPEDVIAMADILARRATRPVVLLMLGPVRQDLVKTPDPGGVDVRWLGVRERVEEIIVAGDVELNCSTHDSYNLSLAEAMCCGLPVVTSNVVGIAPEIGAARAGYLFSLPSTRPSVSECPDRIAAVEYLLTLCEDEHKRVATGARARKWAAATFRTRNSAAEFSKLQ
jgi:glycosyltransferase involved in cell wall biosynthesis